MIRNTLQSWLLLVAINSPLSVAAQVRPELLPPHDSLLVQGLLEFLVDSSGQWTLDDVRQRVGLFRVSGSSHLLVGVSRPFYWLRVRVVNRATRPMSLMASLNYPYLDEAQFYLLAGSGQLVAHSGPLDWTVLPPQRTVVHRNPVFPFTLAPAQSRWLYARLARTSGPVVVRMWVQTDRLFHTNDRQERLFWNWTLGILCWLVVMSVLLGVLLKESLYGYYGLYVLSTTVFLMVAKGFWIEWFPARYYGLISARHFSAQLTFISIFAAFIFIRFYILAANWPRLWVRRVYYLCFIPVLFNLLLTSLERPFPDLFTQQASWLAPVVSSFSLISILMMYGLVVWQSLEERHRNRINIWQSPAQLYLLSLVPLIVHITGNILRNYEVLPGYTIPRHEGLALAYLLEFMFLIVGLGYRYKRITNDRQQLTQANLQQQLLLQQEQNRTLQTQLRIQQEKERIARDLHDHVGAQLSVIASSLDHVRLSGQPNGTASQLEAIGNHARDAISSLRETIWAINREYLPLGEFQIQLQQYLYRQQQLLPDCRVQLRADLANPAQLLTSEQALNLFRIVQEAVSNALRHARADTIEVTISTDNTGQLQLAVTDDGAGFDANLEHPGHYGLLNMKLRAERLGGEWCVLSETSRGTTLSLAMSLQPVTVNATV